MAARTAAKARPKDYGPVQFPDRLGLPLWAFERAASGLPGGVSGADRHPIRLCRFK
jgi:hypothetical protein